MKPKTSLRFDSREIAVLFSLFVFVSLLMFTVGIMVGKGLTQAKYENAPESQTAPGHDVADSPEHSGSSVSMGHVPQPAAHSEKSENAHGKEAHAPEHAVPSAEHAPAHGEEKVAAKPHDPDTHANNEGGWGHDAEPAQHASKPAEKIKLVPLNPAQPEQMGTALSEKNTREANQLLKNPKILSLLEDEPVAVTRGRKPSSATPVTSKPASPGATYTVQIGSYPSETAAKERVDTLKKMGFTGAFFSAKELGASSGTWHRVYLGQYPSAEVAKQVGDQLQAKGEVKNYIVRKN